MSTFSENTPVSIDFLNLCTHYLFRLSIKRDIKYVSQ